MKTSIQKSRPKFLELRRIKLPITGIVSIGHRASGIFLVLSIPFWLYLLNLSLSGEEGYESALKITDSFLFFMAAVLAFWALMHHFFAGIRFLLLDLDIGIEKEMALKFSKIVFVAEAVSLLFIIGWLL